MKILDKSNTDKSMKLDQVQGEIEQFKKQEGNLNEQLNRFNNELNDVSIRINS